MAERPLADGDILALTEDGLRALLAPGTTLAAPELEVLVLVDGQSTAARIARRAQSASRPTMHARLASLVEDGYLRITEDPFGGMIDPGDYFKSSTRSERALDEADAAFLTQSGYSVNLARSIASKEPASNGERPLSVLVVDDDPDISALLQKYLKLEGLDVRMAATPEEVVVALRARPSPDLVLLDLDFPRVDGFQILARIRKHPVLGAQRVIMLTGTATREVVLKGLLLGADGHVTKPFKIHALVRAVKTVLGLAFDPNEQDWDLSL
jgi:CheY-like chemotaxis protein